MNGQPEPERSTCSPLDAERWLPAHCSNICSLPPPKIMPPAPKPRQREGPELFIGLVGATGTDLDAVASALAAGLANFEYDCRSIRLSGLLRLFYSDLPARGSTPRDEYVIAYQDKGDDFRTALKRGDALALAAINQVGAIRQESSGSPTNRLERTAFLLTSFKTQEEVATLRAIWGPRFVVLSAYSPRDARVNDIARRIEESDPARAVDDFRSKAEWIIARDEAEEENDYGQDVRKTFPRADFFIDARGTETITSSVERCLDLLFGYPFATPTRDEHAMFHAHAAELRSAELGRQVGAAITTEDGDLIAIGTNEVPRPGGGLYWEGDANDARDFQKGRDANEVRKRQALEELLVRLKKAKLLSKAGEKIDGDALSRVLDNTRIDNIIEFGRAVHAEMAALTDAAVRGVSVKRGTVYSTTFPCHLCARHIVAAGIKRVVYIDPYPKSLAAHLHEDAIAIDQAHPAAHLVHFEPFVGVAPRAYSRVFTAGKRKQEGGQIVDFHRPEASPKLVRGEVFDVEPIYTAREVAALKIFNQLLGKHGFEKPETTKDEPKGGD
jgi:deoxycytidylate deaminase